MIGFYSVWPSFLLTCVVCAAVRLPAFNVLDSPPALHPRAPRNYSIDGLRGFLALAVVFHHLAIMHRFTESGSASYWGPPPVRFYALLGPAAVSMFFMITSFLFWSRALSCTNNTDWARLYLGRIFRIGPLYLFALCVALLIDGLLLASPVRFLSANGHAAKQVSSALLLGLSVYPDVNKVLVGVTWSIQYEWFFYLSLPLLALLSYSRNLRGLVLSTLLACCLAYRAIHSSMLPGQRSRAIIIALFLTGMLCSYLHEKKWTVALPDRLMSVMTVAAFAAIFVFKDAYTPIPLLILGFAFYLVVSGCTVFGLLTSRAAIRLGDVSYGVYLLQGLALGVVFRPSVLRDFAQSSPWAYWGLAALALMLLVVLATVTFYFIERPGIDLGRRIAKRAFRLSRKVAPGT